MMSRRFGYELNVRMREMLVFLEARLKSAVHCCYSVLYLKAIQRCDSVKSAQVTS